MVMKWVEGRQYTKYFVIYSQICLPLRGNETDAYYDVYLM